MFGWVCMCLCVCMYACGWECVCVYEKCAGGDSNVLGIEPVLGKVSVEEMTFVVVLVYFGGYGRRGGKKLQPSSAGFHSLIWKNN